MGRKGGGTNCLQSNFLVRTTHDGGRAGAGRNLLLSPKHALKNCAVCKRGPGPLPQDTLHKRILTHCQLDFSHCVSRCSDTARGDGGRIAGRRGVL